jgi:hypothetical protein
MFMRRRNGSAGIFGIWWISCPRNERNLLAGADLAYRARRSSHACRLSVLSLALRPIFPVDIHDHLIASALMVLLFVMPIVVDVSICFAILGGGISAVGQGSTEGTAFPAYGLSAEVGPSLT